MDRILRYLRPLITVSSKFPYAVVGFVIISGVIGGYFGTHLKIDTDLANLLPQENPHVIALDSLQKIVGGGTSMAVAIQSPSFEDNLRFAKDFIHQSLQLWDTQRNAPYFDRGNYKRNVDVLRNNALYFATSKELNEIISYLNEKIEEINRKANPFLINFNTDEQQDSSDEKLEHFEHVYNQLIPSKYTISKDSTVMLVHLEPAGSKANLAYVDRLFSKLDSLITAMNPTSYNPSMKVYYANRLWSHLQQFKSIQKDVFSSFGTGLSSIILLVMIYFFIRKYLRYRKGREKRSRGLFAHILRIPVAALVIGLPLLIGLIWTFAITYAIYGTLNTMTAVLFVILFGFAIDYGVHFYARYLEFRASGNGVVQSIFKTYDNAGSAIAASGLTTSFSLYILLFANIRGFSEFGFIAGTGVILALFCMLYVLPALLVIFERWNWILINPRSQQQTVASQSHSRYPFSRTIVIIGTVIAIVVVVNYNHLHFQYNFGKLQPTFKRAEIFDAVAAKAGRGHKRNPAYLLADNRQEVKEIAATLRHRMRTDTISPTILDVEALPERFPKTQEQIEAKLQKIAKIRKLLNKPVIKNKESKQLDKLRQAAQTTEAVSLSEIPEYFKSKFTTKSGEVGNFVIVYPSVTLADSRNSIAFMHDVGEVTLDSGEKVYAASTSIIGAQIIVLLQRESPWLIGGTLAMFFLLSFYSFRSVKWALIAMAPLIIGLIFMFGIMMLTGALLNLYNLIILPAILGVGGDNGIHTVSRYIEEGPGSHWEVLSSTGEHSIVCSFANMLGFSGLFFPIIPASSRWDLWRSQVSG